MVRVRVRLRLRFRLRLRVSFRDSVSQLGVSEQHHIGQATHRNIMTRLWQLCLMSWESGKRLASCVGDPVSNPGYNIKVTD